MFNNLDIQTLHDAWPAPCEPPTTANPAGYNALFAKHLEPHEADSLIGHRKPLDVILRLVEDLPEVCLGIADAVLFGASWFAMLSLALSLVMVVVALFMGTFQYLNASALEMAKDFGAKKLAAAKNIAGATNHAPAPPLLSPSPNFGGQRAVGKGPPVFGTYAQQQMPQLPPGIRAHAQQQMPQLPPGIGAHAQQQMPQLPPGIRAHAQQQMPQLPPGIRAHAQQQMPQLPPGIGAHAQQQMPQLPPGIGAHAQRQMPQLPPGIRAHAQQQMPQLPPAARHWGTCPAVDASVAARH